jgi:adenylate cyclase
MRKNRSEHLEPVVAKYGGRLVKLTGDGALVEFDSAVDALSAAIEFQQAMAEANSDQPADTALVFRMGLHLGDLHQQEQTQQQTAQSEDPDKPER